MATFRIAIIAPAVVVAASLLSGCGGLVAGPSATPAYCNGVPTAIGGCDHPPTYQGTTCGALAAEWGTVVNDRVLKVISEPQVVNEENRSVRIHSALVLATVTLGPQLDQLGLLGACTGREVLAGAQASFSADLKAKVGGALYDGNPPATWEQFEAEVLHVVKVFDVPTSSASPAA